MNAWQQELDTAVTIAREVGELLKAGYNEKKTIEKKSSAVDWVTQYDTAAEELITTRLRAAFPEHGLVGEEGADVAGNGRFQWYVDPLDGTTNFAHDFPVFCVSLALWEGNTPRVGVVYDPLRDECFAGAAGQGATLTSPRGRRRLQVTAEAQLHSAVLATGFPYDRVNHTNGPVTNIAETAAFLRQVQGIRRAGSAALDMAYVAAGRLDGYWEYRLFAWDMAAAVLLVQEAGGAVTMIDGSPLQISRQLSLLVSNGRLHDTMLATIQAAGS